MTDFVKTGAVLILLGFLAIGSVSLYFGTAPTPTTIQGIRDRQQVGNHCLQVTSATRRIEAGVGLRVLGVRRRHL